MSPRQRPAATPEHPSDAWLNVFVLHQNRVAHGPLAKACVREEQLPDFLDLAVWGHEHECRWGRGVVLRRGWTPFTLGP